MVEKKPGRGYQPIVASYIIVDIDPNIPDSHSYARSNPKRLSRN